MKVIVFGANGGIGSQVVQQALGTGHEVTAIARRPASVTLQHERLRIVQGDVLDPATYTSVMRWQDAVVSALGSLSKEPTTLYSQGIKNIAQAMQAAGVRRMVCMSANGLEPGPLVQRIFAKPLLWRAFKNQYDDLVRMEAAVSESGLDWTIMRPPMLTNTAHTGHYDTAINRHLSHGWKISRADVADYIVKHLNDAATYGALVEIAS